MKYEINGKQVVDMIKKDTKEIEAVHVKHERWRNLRKFLKIYKAVRAGNETQVVGNFDEIDFPRE